MNSSIFNHQYSHPKIGSLPILIVIFFSIIIFYAILMFLLFSLNKNLNLISKKNRRISPNSVWLNLIPFFNFYWIFRTIFDVYESNKREFIDRDILLHGGGFGFEFGKAFCVLFLISSFCFVTFVILIPTLICMFIYWAKILDLNKILENSVDLGKKENFPD